MMELFATLVLPVILGLIVSFTIYSITKHHKSKAFTIYAVFSGLTVFRCISCIGMILSNHISVQLSAIEADKAFFYDACTQQIASSFILFSIASLILLIVEVVLPMIMKFHCSQGFEKEESS